MTLSFEISRYRKLATITRRCHVNLLKSSFSYKRLQSIRNKHKRDIMPRTAVSRIPTSMTADELRGAIQSLNEEVEREKSKSVGWKMPSRVLTEFHNSGHLGILLYKTKVWKKSNDLVAAVLVFIQYYLEENIYAHLDPFLDVDGIVVLIEFMRKKDTPPCIIGILRVSNLIDFGDNGTLLVKYCARMLELFPQNEDIVRECLIILYNRVAVLNLYEMVPDTITTSLHKVIEYHIDNRQVMFEVVKYSTNSIQIWHSIKDKIEEQNIHFDHPVWRTLFLMLPKAIGGMQQAADMVITQLLVDVIIEIFSYDDTIGLAILSELIVCIETTLWPESRLRQNHTLLKKVLDNFPMNVNYSKILSLLLNKETAVLLRSSAVFTLVMRNELHIDPLLQKIPILRQFQHACDLFIVLFRKGLMIWSDVEHVVKQVKNLFGWISMVAIGKPNGNSGAPYTLDPAYCNTMGNLITVLSSDRRIRSCFTHLNVKEIMERYRTVERGKVGDLTKIILELVSVVALREIIYDYNYWATICELGIKSPNTIQPIKDKYLLLFPNIKRGERSSDITFNFVE